MDHINFPMQGMAAPPPHQRAHHQHPQHQSIIPPPPQPPVFGAYAPVVPDAMSQLPPDLAAQFMSDAHFAYDDGQDPKRRRIARVRHHRATA